MTDSPGLAITDVSRLLRRSFDARARSIGVTRAQWQVLSALRRHEGINQSGLADILDVEPITVCRMVDRLQEADLVERRSNPTDRRTWHLFLTPKAGELLQLLRPLADEMLEHALEGVAMDERAQLIATLNRMRTNLSRRAVHPVLANG